MPREWWTKKDMPCLIGKLAIVTGAAGGLGFQIAQGLAEAGSDVILLDKDEKGGKLALEKLQSLLPERNLSFECVDLGNLKNIKDFCTQVNTKGRALDILVNNAGLLLSKRSRKPELTMDGFEVHFGVNYLAHYALVAQLLPSLRRSSAGRVVNVASVAYRFGKIYIDDLQLEKSYKGFRAYAQSKLAVLLFTLELQRRSDEGKWGLTVVTSHPGNSATRIAGPISLKLYYGSFDFWLKPLIQFMDPAIGALPALFAATDLRVEPGEYYGPSDYFETRGPVGVSYRAPKARDSELAKKLWQISANLTKVTWPQS